ncbi:MAG: hypothetical protein MJD61_01010 [Proteobacteria bacterium]|nr:hypothetical protein [Pseudomonadota bacterium]
MLVACSAALPACKGSNGAAGSEQAPAPSSRSASEQRAPGQAALQAGPPSPRVQESHFRLQASPVGSYRDGELGQALITLEPRGEFHINQDFPCTVELTASANLMLPKARLAKVDATHFGERRARFDVPLTPRGPGTHEVEARVAFAVCTEETCIPEERRVVLALRVAPSDKADP